MSTIKKMIQDRLQAALSPTLLVVDDVSEQHRGHGGWREGGETHFNVLIVSDAFDGQSRVARQRQVMAPLADLMDNPIHALSIKAQTASEH